MTADPKFGRLVAAVERLSREVPELKGSIDRMEAALVAAQDRTEEVAQTSSVRTRSLRRRWIVPMLVAVLVVAGLALAGFYEQHQTARDFAHVRAGLVAGCEAQQDSNAALRTKNMLLLADARARAASLAAATAPDGQTAALDLLRRSTDADAAAYEGYLKAIPPPVDCEARYG